VATEKGAIESACWFWNTKKLNAVADAGDIVKMTKIINGGDIGLADRKKRYEAAIAILSGGKVSSAPVLRVVSSDGLDLNTTLIVGSTGATVKALQEKLGIEVDGTFGLGTRRAVKDWQAKNGLVADGTAGPKTLTKLLG
jgi:murein L,D-transpeptidase YcbB/YkuD